MKVTVEFFEKDVEEMMPTFFAVRLLGYENFNRCRTDRCN